jgi:hypothetical protein
MKLTAQNVIAVTERCSFTEAELGAHPDKRPPDAVIGTGIMATYGYHPVRIKEAESDILDMLHQLPESFQKDSSEGGMSFLNAAMDKDGEQWGEHYQMDLLFMLGDAIGAVHCPFPRPVWPKLPGGMPYYTLTR